MDNKSEFFRLMTFPSKWGLAYKVVSKSTSLDVCMQFIWAVEVHARYQHDHYWVDPE